MTMRQEDYHALIAQAIVDTQIMKDENIKLLLEKDKEIERLREEINRIKIGNYQKELMIREKDKILQEKELIIQEKKQQIKEKEQKIQENNKILQEKKQQIKELELKQQNIDPNQIH